MHTFTKHTLTILFTALLAAILPLQARQRLTIPAPHEAITVDGQFGEAEWAPNASIDTLADLNGFPVQGTETQIRLMADDQFLYLGITTDPGPQTDTASPHLTANETRRDGDVHKDDAVEIIIGRQDGTSMHQLVLNSKDVLYDSTMLPVTTNSWNIRGLEARSRLNQLRWDLEVKLPLQEVNLKPGEPFLLNVCRDWTRKGYSSLSAAGYFNREAMLLVTPDSTAGAFRQTFTQDDHRLTFKLKGKKGLQAALEIIAPNQKVVSRDVRMIPRNGETVLTGTMMRGQDCNRVRLTVRDREAIIHLREFKVREQRRSLLPPPMKTLSMKKTGGTVTLRAYPGYRRLALTGAFPPESPVRTLILKGTGASPLNTRLDIQDGLAYGLVELPDASPGSHWDFQLEALDGAGRTLERLVPAFDVTTPSWPWLDAGLGKDDILIPPFTPLNYQNGKLHALLRTHTIGPLGFWSQVKAQDREILSRPIQLNAVVDGKTQRWETGTPRLVKATDTKVQLSYRARTSQLAADIRVTYDFDGMAWYELTLSPQGKPSRIDELYLTLGLKAKEATYLHCTADDIRENVCGNIPQGHGEVWNSKAVPRLQHQGKDIVRDGFIPYLWMGGISRGLCFFADSPENFHLDATKPMMTIGRTRQEVLATLRLSTKASLLKRPETIQFGFQATPVKPKPDFNRSITGITWRKLPGATTLLFPPRPPGFINDFDHEPRKGMDWSLMRTMCQQTHAKNVPNDRLQRLKKTWEQALNETYAPWTAKLKSMYGRYMGRKSPLDYWTGRITGDFQGYYNRAQNCDKVIFYSDPRLMHVDTPEYQAFQAEWWCTRPVGYLRAARTFLVPSFIDYMLWSVKQQLDQGADGIYYDDTFLLPRANPELGKPEAEMGILAMRELMKRTAVMLWKHNQNPMLMVHHTDALIIPAFSFANMAFTWEMRFNPIDTQERFPEDYILTESAGNQCGLVPFIINGIKHWSGFAGTPRWPAFFKHKSKAIIATVLQYDIKLWSNWDIREDIAYWTLYPLYQFGMGDKDCQFIPFWENQDLVTVGKDYRAAVYLKPDAALIVLSNFGDRQPAAVTLNLKALKLPEGSMVTDLLSHMTAPASQTFRVPVPFHEYTILHVGNPEDARKLLPAEGRNLLSAPAEITPEATSGSIRFQLMKASLPWTQRPAFIGKAATKRASLKTDSAGNLVFAVDNTGNSQMGGMVWTLDVPIVTRKNYTGMEVSMDATNTSTRQPVCFTACLDDKQTNIRYFNSKRDFHTGAQGQGLHSDTIMKDVMTIKRLFIRVEAKPNSVGTLILKDVRFTKPDDITPKPLSLKLDSKQPWITRPTFVGSQNRMANHQAHISENMQGETVFTVDNSNQPQVGGMVWTLDRPYRLNTRYRQLSITFDAENLDTNQHFFPLAMSVTYADGHTAVREFDLLKAGKTNDGRRLVDIQALNGAQTIRRLFIRVHARPHSVGKLAVKDLKLLP